MKTAEAVFVLHGDVNRKSRILELINDDCYIVVWPDTSYEDAIKNLKGFDQNKHHVINIGSSDKLYIGRNNIINWCKENGITRFWMLDDDISKFRLGGPSQEFKDKVFTDGKCNVKNIEFDDDTGLGGLAMAGCMFNYAVDKPMFSQRFIWAMIFIDLSINHIMYSVEGYDDIDMQLECFRNGIKFQTINWLGHIKPQWTTKKSLNSKLDKINYNNYLIYKKWGDSTKIDVYYAKGTGEKFYRIHVRYPYRYDANATPKFNTTSLEAFVESLDKEFEEHPETFKVCGLPHMRGKSTNSPVSK